MKDHPRAIRPDKAMQGTPQSSVAVFCEHGFRAPLMPNFGPSRRLCGLAKSAIARLRARISGTLAVQGTERMFFATDHRKLSNSIQHWNNLRNHLGPWSS